MMSRMVILLISIISATRQSENGSPIMDFGSGSGVTPDCDTSCTVTDVVSLPVSFSDTRPTTNFLSNFFPSSSKLLVSPSISISLLSSESLSKSLSSFDSVLASSQVTYLASTSSFLLTTQQVMSMGLSSSSLPSPPMSSRSSSSVSISRTMTITFSTRTSSTVDLITSVFPSLTPSASNTVLPPSTVPIAAVSAGVAVIVAVVACLSLIICIVCCVKKRKKKFVLTTAGSGVDGTTEAKEYKLYGFTESRNRNSESNAMFGQQAEPSVGTFGKTSPTLNSPVEVELGTGGTIRFPDTPIANSGESLPALIIYNPVKSAEVLTSNTLPTRGKQKCSLVLGTGSEAAVDQPVSLGTHVTASKSTSEINSVLLPVVGDLDKLQSPIYDRPCVLETATNANTMPMTTESDVVSGEYVTMEPNPKVLPSEKERKVSDTDRLAPKRPSASSEPSVSLVSPNKVVGDSLYDNPRLIRSQKIDTFDKKIPVSSPDPQVGTSSVYDVPRKILKEVKPEDSSLPHDDKGTKKVLPTSPENVSESVYAIPKQQVHVMVDKLSGLSPVSKPEGIYDHPKSMSQSTGLSPATKAPMDMSSNTDTGSDTKLSKSKPLIPLKPSSTSLKPAEDVFLTSSISSDIQVTYFGPSIEDEHVYDVPPLPRHDEDTPMLEVSVQQPEIVSSQLEQAKPKLLPKPCPKPRKLVQVSKMPLSIVQELHTKQSVKSEDSNSSTDVKLSPKHTKSPVVKPKPNTKRS